MKQGETFMSFAATVPQQNRTAIIENSASRAIPAAERVATLLKDERVGEFDDKHFHIFIEKLKRRVNASDSYAIIDMAADLNREVMNKHGETGLDQSFFLTKRDLSDMVDEIATNQGYAGEEVDNMKLAAFGAFDRTCFPTLGARAVGA